MKEIHVIDSHTAGEPTRVVIAGGPPLGAGPVAQRLELFRKQHDAFRSAIVNEPRGSNVLVGALLLEPSDPSCAAAVIFFNNVGYLGMCGHGTIGLMVTLARMGRVKVGQYKIETPVGIVTAKLHPDGDVSVTNVPSFRKARDVTVQLPSGGTATGDVAWGGNWFFLVDNHDKRIDLADVNTLIDYSASVRRAINSQGFPEVDHIELFGPPSSPGAHSRNFVLCPGIEYDRSPCGTGTCAKLACLAEDGKLAEGDSWVQESVIGTRFTGCYHHAGGQIIPTITGAAHVNAEAKLLLDDRDPLCWGMRAGVS